MRWIAAVTLVLAFALTAAPTFAFPHINTISSETLNTEPLLVNTTFTVQLVGYEPFAYWGFHVEAGEGSGVQFFDCEAPSSWNCLPSPVATHVHFNPPSGSWPWPGVMTFTIMTDQAEPCVKLVFENGILGKTPQTNQAYEIAACLVVDAPTPAAPVTWGAIKATYR